jgi:hypothetical protein
MNQELQELHRNPPDEHRIYLEIGRTILAVQPTEKAFNAITLIVIPDKPFTVEGLAGFDPDKKSKTLGQLKHHLVEKLKADLDSNFLAALGKLIDDRNALVHNTDAIPGWNLKTTNGRIAAFIFLKNLQLTNILLLRILIGLAFHYDRKHMYGSLAKAVKKSGLFPGVESQEQLAKQLFGIDSPSQENG